MARFFINLAVGDLIISQSQILLAQPVEETGSIQTGKATLRGHATFSQVLFNLIHDQKIRRELELTENQVEALGAVFSVRPEQFHAELERLVAEQGVQNGSVAERQQLGREAHERLQASAMAKVGDVLLPHQIDALKRFAIREIKQRSGEAGLFSTQWLREELDITDEQLERIKERAEEEARILNQKIQELKAAAEYRILQELTEEQRNKLGQLMGTDDR